MFWILSLFATPNSVSLLCVKLIWIQTPKRITQIMIKYGRNRISFPFINFHGTHKNFIYNFYRSLSSRPIWENWIHFDNSFFNICLHEMTLFFMPTILENELLKCIQFFQMGLEDSEIEDSIIYSTQRVSFYANNIEGKVVKMYSILSNGSWRLHNKAYTKRVIC